MDAIDAMALQGDNLLNQVERSPRSIGNAGER